MSIKKTITVLGIVAVIAFGYISYKDAVRTWQNLQERKRQVHELNIKYQAVNTELGNTVDQKSISETEIQKLEQEKLKLDADRLKLETSLQQGSL